jgi:hypothetical protein
MTKTLLNLEFAPQANKRSAAGSVYLVVAIALFSFAAIHAAKAVSENSAKQQELAVMDSARNAAVRVSAPPPLKVDPTELSRVRFIRMTSRNLAAPWADLLVALEKAPSNVALLAVEPSAAKRTVSLTAEAAGPADMIKYLQALQSDPNLANVVLVSHQVQLQAPGTPLRFQIRASWGEAP